jgi:hypothetical protein
LTLDSCWINYIAQQAAAAAIAALPALKALTLAGSTDLKLAQHVTSLTSLSFSKLHRRVLERDIQQLIAAAARNPGLLCFSVDRAKRAEGDNEGEEDEFFLPDKALEVGWYQAAQQVQCRAPAGWKSCCISSTGIRSGPLTCAYFVVRDFSRQHQSQHPTIHCALSCLVQSVARCANGADDRSAVVGVGVASQLLLTSCPSLQHLDLSVYSLDAEELDVLLEYGTDITYLAVFDIAVAASRAQAPCNIRSLAITNQWHPDIQQLAYLPLKQAISLQFDDDMGTFWAPLGPEALSTDQVPPRLRQAAINLTSCPAWRAAQPSTISLQATHDEAVIGLLSPAYAAQLLEALAPLGSATLVTSFELEFSAHWLPLGSEAVGALRSSLGDGIEALELGNCDLAADFWAALSQHLPNLATLHFKNLCNFQMHDLVMYLMRRPADKPLALTLPTNHYLRVTAENLLASLQLWGVQNVQIIHGHT